MKLPAKGAKITTCVIMDRKIKIIMQSAPTVAENLKMDESLAKACADTGEKVLRFWWGGPITAVLGCGDKPENALELDECEKRGISYIKRVTGGGTVLQTPDVFNYSYTAPNPGNFDIMETFKLGAEFLKSGLAKFGIQAEMQGISDVTVNGRKISGNAQARKWHSILLHGTILVDADYNLMEAVLKQPAKQPEYRLNRSHRDFLVSLADLGVNAARVQIESSFTEAADVFSDKLIL